MKWLGCLGVLVVLALVVGGVVVGKYNGLVGLGQGVERPVGAGREPVPAAGRSRPEPRRDGEGRRRLREGQLKAVVKRARSVGQDIGPRRACRTTPRRWRSTSRRRTAVVALSRLLVVVERYPDLKATPTFATCRRSSRARRTGSAVERMRFNEAAQAYNTERQRFPTVIFANLLGMKEKAYFQATPGSQQPPDVKFNFGASPSPTPAERR